MGNDYIDPKKVKQAEEKMESYLGDVHNTKQDSLSLLKGWVELHLNNTRAMNGIHLGVAAWHHEKRQKMTLRKRDMPEIDKINLQFQIDMSKIYLKAVREYRYFSFS